MSTNSIIISIIAVVVVATGGYLIFSRDTATPVVNSGEVATTTSTTEVASVPLGNDKKMAFDVFLKQGGAYQCTVYQSAANVDSIGTVFLDNGKVSGKYNTTYQGVSYESNLIVRDGYLYTWSPTMLSGKGFKFAVVENTGDTGAENWGTHSWDASQIGDYDCKAWTPDESKFVVPTSITFSEVKK